MEGGKKIESATLSVVHILLHERSICAVWECCAAEGVVKTRESELKKEMRRFNAPVWRRRPVGGELPLYDMLIPLYQHHYYLYLSLLYYYDSIGRITS